MAASETGRASATRPSRPVTNARPRPSPGRFAAPLLPRRGSGPSPNLPRRPLKPRLFPQTHPAFGPESPAIPLFFRWFLPSYCILIKRYNFSLANTSFFCQVVAMIDNTSLVSDNSKTVSESMPAPGGPVAPEAKGQGEEQNQHSTVPPAFP